MSFFPWLSQRHNRGKLGYPRTVRPSWTWAKGALICLGAWNGPNEVWSSSEYLREPLEKSAGRLEKLLVARRDLPLRTMSLKDPS